VIAGTSCRVRGHDERTISVIIFPLQVLDMSTPSGLLTTVSRTRSTISSDGPGRPVRFAAHRQPLCWNFMYHSRIVLSIRDSVWYMVQNHRCTVTTDSVLANSKTQRFLIPCPRLVSSRLPPSGETCKYATAPIAQTYLDRFSAC
jgi:hypothetical protein